MVPSQGSTDRLEDVAFGNFRHLYQRTQWWSCHLCRPDRFRAWLQSVSHDIARNADRTRDDVWCLEYRHSCGLLEEQAVSPCSMQLSYSACVLRVDDE